MAFQQSLSGLNVATKKLDTIGNNVANGNTVGFKQSRTEFADVFATSLFGVASTAVGIGAQVTGIAQQFTQGNISSTSNPTDLAISGNGFFRMEKNGQISYSRNGQFQIDRDGFIVNNGLKLTGYVADALGNITPQPPAALQVAATSITAQQTSNIALTANLDATATTPLVNFPSATPPTSTPDPASFNHSTQITVYDSLGASHAVKLYFRKDAAPVNTWKVFTQFDNTAIAAAPTAFQTLTFNTSGVQSPAPAVLSLAATPTNGAAVMAINMDLTKLTQFAGAFGVSKQTVDGFATGSLTGIATDSKGIVSARFSNGQTKSIGQVVLTNFANPQGLQNLGSNQWGETFTSGTAVVNAPGSGNAGVIQSAALEDSNVDLTAELVNMITAQRFYQANAQSIKTQDQVMQTLLNL